MKTALDSNVILDVITDDAQWAEASEKALRRADRGHGINHFRGEAGMDPVEKGAFIHAVPPKARS